MLPPTPTDYLRIHNSADLCDLLNQAIVITKIWISPICEINPGDIPESVTHIVYESDIKKAICPGMIPNGVKLLDFGNYFDQVILPGSLPESLECLKIGYNYGKSLGPENIPPNVKYLELKSQKDLVQGIVPDTVICLSCNSNKIHDGALPNSIKSLKLGFSFNQILDDILPKHLENLNLGYSFNQKISKGELPDTLRCLEFSEMFNQEIEPGVIPYGVDRINFGFAFKSKLFVGTIPNSVSDISFYNDYVYKNEQCNLPNSIKNITFRHGGSVIFTDQLPHSLETLKMCGITYNVKKRNYDFYVIKKTSTETSVEQITDVDYFLNKIADHGTILTNITTEDIKNSSEYTTGTYNLKISDNKYLQIRKLEPEISRGWFLNTEINNIEIVAEYELVDNRRTYSCL